MIIDECARVGNRVKLLGVPSFNGIVFGQGDVHELLSILPASQRLCNNKDSIKVPRLHAIIASKACRSAVMIGTPLNLCEMRKLLTKLRILDQPWNCPHGR